MKTLHIFAQTNICSYIMRAQNYDKYPAIPVEGSVCLGWELIRKKLHSCASGPLFVDYYTGVFEEDMARELGSGFARVIRMRDYMKPEAAVRSPRKDL